LIDIGVNLLHPQFDPDRQAVIERSRLAGITCMIVTGTDLEVSRAAVDLCRQPGAALVCTAGIHPHDARSAPSGWREDLRALAREAPVVAIGETGLDFNRNFSPPHIQEKLFRDQLALAAELNLPVFVHERDASDSVLQTLNEVLGHRGCASLGVVVHCFTGDLAALDAYLELGCHIGITGWVCDRRRGAGLRALVPRIPLDRLLAETDAPFLRPHNAPADNHGRRNEPALLPWVIATLAEQLELPPERIAQETAANAQRLFRLSPTPSGFPDPTGFLDPTGSQPASRADPPR
jgi:TatD DNase family protein